MSSQKTTPAFVKYCQMLVDFDPEPYVQYAIRHGWAVSEKDAQKSITTALQWLAWHATSEFEAPSVMMNCPAARFLEVFRRNPRLFQAFCREKLGYVVHFREVDFDQSAEIEDGGGIDYTLAALAKAYGTELCEGLHDWAVMRQHHELVATLVVLPGEATTADSAMPENFREVWADSPLLRATACS